jgi:rhodanese-related sulfurtransferase
VTVSRVEPDREHDGSAVDELLAAVRRGVERVTADRLAAEMDAGALVVDIRPVEQRARDGLLPGALVVDRNVLEWRLDPTCPHRLPEAGDPHRRIVLVCNEGYSSSLAAETLRRLGLAHATDLVGGYQAMLASSSSERVPHATEERARPPLA